ncbi:DNA alkylation repair protein [Marinomonas sp. RSW2]|uniref:DNA alkylation repair protein n=1 Tax=Marinomonas maritima TaxID=2940935 RepID=A0ABT5WAB7_9GAMM|nr:DNA alkylation repair protein [Marinomonas maritima]MDE8601768.1 DNA alkylation repair protein [Marinomonas maritima]
MPEPFKNLFNQHVINDMAEHFQRHSREFDKAGFVAAAIDQLETLELKARSQQITEVMSQYLPTDFEKAGQILLASLAPETDDSNSEASGSGISGWSIMPMGDYVGRHGLEHHDFSMVLLKAMTSRFTSEFSIRFFLLSAPEKTLAALNSWLLDDNKHVRRLISEGTRPRLPWAMQLPAFIKDPSPVIALLEKLKDDPEEYVRRSVANNLNDIAKDHPDLVADIAERWMKGADKNRTKLIRHACRTLLKQGNNKVLTTFGYGKPQLENNALTIHSEQVILNGNLEFTLEIESAGDHEQTLMIDYIIHHQKKNGTTSPKVFKWKKITLAAHNRLTMAKKHPFKIITTRVYYDGLHEVEISINGHSIAKKSFQLSGNPPLM